MRTEILFQHGWGFDGSMWSGWRQRLRAQSDITTKVADRGYFRAIGNAEAFTSNAEHKVIVAHSLGLHFLPKALIEQCDALVLLNGFLHFHPRDPLKRKRSERVLRTMHQKFQNEPAQVLTDFWSNCYQPTHRSLQVLPAGTVNADTLGDDLLLLGEARLDAEVLQSVPRILVVNAMCDQIVDADVSEDLLQSLPHAVPVTLSAAPHAMPLTHIDECVHLLNHWILGKQRNHVATQNR